MSAISVVVFPTPPPTSNTLTSSQRAHLMRSTKKIGRVLGFTPHVVDSRPSSPSYLDWSDDEDYYRPSSRGSVDSSSSSSLASRSSRFSRPSTSNSLRSAKSSISTSSSHTDDYWSESDSAKPPLLRLALTSKPKPTKIKTSSSPLSQLASSSSDSDEDLRFTLRPPSCQSHRDSLISPTFHILTSVTTRREKMDRIRRKLGDGVPIDLVFPHYDSDEEDEPSSPDSVRPSPVIARLPPPPPPPSSGQPTRVPRTRSTGSSIVNARDSIISTTTPHRAHRIKRKPVPKLDIEPSRPAPPPPPRVEPSQLEVKEEQDHARPLSLILESPYEESPLEHKGMWTSVSRTLPLQVERRVSNRASTSKVVSPTSEWFSEDEGDASAQLLTYVEYMKMVDDLGNFTD